MTNFTKVFGSDLDDVLTFMNTHSLVINQNCQILTVVRTGRDSGNAYTTYTLVYAAEKELQ